MRKYRTKLSVGCIGSLKSLTILRWANGALQKGTRALLAHGYAFAEMRNLRELYFDHSMLHFYGHAPDFLSYIRDRLEKDSCVGVKVSKESEHKFKPLEQEELMNFVRNAPNLTWFRSD